MKYPLLAALLLAFATPLRASLWDDETLAGEANGLPGLVAVITGRFEQNPPSWYELRRSRAVEEIAANPNNLGAYDVAGVACDRLGQNDEAIAWMERKSLQMETTVRSGARTIDDVREHRYRCLANAGTFWMHRWQRGGARRSQIDEITIARELIAKAVLLNPPMSFERERCQLRILGAILSPPELKQGPLPPLLDLSDPANRTDEAVRGLEGLIVWGDDGQSLDIWNTLAQVLEHTSPGCAAAQLARLRCHELIDAGQRSLLPGAPAEAQALALAIDRAATPQPKDGDGTREDAEREMRAAYRALRNEAEAWQNARNAFLTKRFEQGRHPDSDPDFWNGFGETNAPKVEIPATQTSVRSAHARALRRLQGILIAFVAGTLLSAFLAWMTVRKTMISA